jgi:peptidoglycan/LPS O-acetylase OafA/YrhL
MAVQRPSFRPDLEGLRGVAILLVVLFHAGVPGLAGGFVGVDVFFVLSGFFITGLLARDLAETGQVRVREFYGQRALRLLPVLLVVLLATLALVMTLYAPIDRAAVATTARSVALSTSNLEFARSAVNYFGSRDNPLLHTWSLAVEEQFYLVWPLLLALFALLVGRRGLPVAGDPATSSPPDGLLRWIVGVGIVSFGASIWVTQLSQPWAFFGLGTRLWEFALGGALALGLRTRPEEVQPRATLLSGVGLLLIALAVRSYDRTTPYPGAAALLPAAGTALLLVGGGGAAQGAVGRALSASWLRGLGRLSYAWYLWHWPLVGLGEVLAPEIGVPGRLAWSALALALAWLTYRLVEQPARDGRLSRLPAFQRSAIALGATLGVVLIALGARRAAERRAAQPDQRAFAAAREDRMEHDCWARGARAPRASCAFGDTTSSTVVALFGDSHAEHWLAGLDRVGRERGWKIVAMVRGGCPVADLGLDATLRGGRRDRECARHREATLRRIVAMRPAAAILSSWDHYVPVDGEPSDAWQVSPDAWQRGLRRSYARLSAAGIPVATIRGTPRTWFDVPACLSRRAADLPLAGDCTYERRRALSPVAAEAQMRAARGLRVRIVDLNDRICATPRCAVQRDGLILFTDDNHLTASFTRSLAPVLGPRLVAAFAELGVRLP